MNSQEIYKGIAGIGRDPTPEENEKLRQLANVEQKNLEAWAQWRELPQTQFFRNKLKIVADTINKLTANYCANVPAVSNDYIRARMVEAHLLNEIVDITMHNGKLKEHIFKEPTY